LTPVTGSGFVDPVDSSRLFRTSSGGRVRQSLLASVMITVVAGGAFLAPSPAEAVPPAARAPQVAAGSPQGYVALGDSYSSGEGVKPFLERGPCHRSTRAYPTQVLVPGTDTTWYRRRADQGYAWGLLACSGATTRDVRTSQIDAPSRTGNSSYLELDETTRLVTITVGGDDARFRDVLTFCALGHTSCSDDAFGKQRTLDLWLRRRMTSLRPKLSATYRAVHTKAPQAQILVLGYPQLFPDSRAEQNCVYLKQRKLTVKGKTYSVLFSHAEQNFLRLADDRLNTTIRAATRDSGVATFVPVGPAFVDHEVCGSGGPWVNHVSVTVTRTKPYLAAADKSFHPNAVGQAAYASLVNAQISSAPPS
jgi:hypothetical protein